MATGRAGRVVGGTGLWTCPRCGAKLISRNLWHACGDHSVEAFLAGKGERGRELFARFAAMIAACGRFEVAPAKTRVAFMAKVRFASVNRVGDDHIDVHLVLPRAIESPRFRKVERIGKVHVHHLRLRDARDLDGELAGWLRQSYEEYGQRGWLTSRAAVARSARRPRSGRPRRS
jgi:hypothetical protein